MVPFSQTKILFFITDRLAQLMEAIWILPKFREAFFGKILRALEK
jgi:hypothetical protein